MTQQQSSASSSERESRDLSGEDSDQLSILPSLVTLLNALVGLMAVSQIFKVLLSASGYREPAVPFFGPYLNEWFSTAQDHLMFAGWLILIGMVLDSLDGKIARLTDSTSIFGIELDSLCDAVTFGVAPALMMYVAMYLLRIESSASHPFLFFFSFPVAVLYLCCVLVRLARFNVNKDPESDDHGDFNGLPSPAAAGFIASGLLLILTLFGKPSLNELFRQPVVRISLQVTPWLVTFLSISMVSQFRYPHLMDNLEINRKSIGHAAVFLVLLTALVLSPALTLFLIFFLYAAAGPLDTLLFRITGE